MFRRPSPAIVIALVALFFTLSGAAFAAQQYVISSKSQINPKVLKSLKGKRGLRGKVGPKGPKGATGPTGATGALGATGPAGPFPDALASGKTIRGAFNIGGGSLTGTTVGQLANTSISFIYQFAAAPTVKLVLLGTTPPAQCPGTAALPQALPGFLCIYEEGTNNTTGLQLNGVSRSGATIYIFATATGSNFFSYGTWAATAA